MQKNKINFGETRMIFERVNFPGLDRPISGGSTPPPLDEDGERIARADIEQKTFDTAQELLNEVDPKIVHEIYLDAIKAFTLSHNPSEGSDLTLNEIEAKYEQSGGREEYNGAFYDVINNLGSLDSAFKEKLRSPAVEGILGNVQNESMPVNQDDFNDFVEMLVGEDTRLVDTPDASFIQMQMREILGLLITNLRKKGQLESMVNGLDLETRKSFLVYSIYYPLLSEREASQFVMNADDIQPEDKLRVAIEIMDRRDEMHVNLRTEVDNDERARKLFEELAKIIKDQEKAQREIEQTPEFQEKSDEDKKEALGQSAKGFAIQMDAVYIKLQALGISMDKASSYLQQSRNEVMAKKLKTNVENRMFLEENLNILIDSLENGNFETEKNLKIVKEMKDRAFVLNDKMAIAIMEHAEKELGNGTFDQVALAKVLKAYVEIPKIYGNIENIFSYIQDTKGKGNIYDIEYKKNSVRGSLDDLKMHLDILHGIGIDVSEGMKLYDNLNELPGIINTLKEALRNSKDDDLDDIERIIGETGYGDLIKEFLIKNGFELQDFREKKRARKLKEFLIKNLDEADLGLGVMESRENFITSLEDSLESLKDIKIVKLYDDLMLHLETNDTGEEEAAKKLEELITLAQEAGYEDLANNLIACRGNVRDVNENVIRVEIDELRSKVDSISADDVFDQLSRQDPLSSSKDFDEFQSKLMAIQADPALTDQQKKEQSLALAEEYAAKFQTSVRYNYEFGADLGQDMVSKSRNPLMRHMTYSGLLNLLLGVWGVATTAVNGIASIASIITSGVIGKDWDKAMDRVMKNSIWLGTALTAIKVSKDGFNKSSKEMPRYMFGRKGTEMLEYLDRRFDANDTEAQLHMSEGGELGLFIMGSRKFSDKDNADIMSKFMLAYRHSQKTGTEINTFAELEAIQEGLTIDEIVNFVADANGKEGEEAASFKANLKGLLLDPSNEKDVIHQIFQIIRFGSWNKMSPIEISKTASAASMYLDDEFRAAVMIE